LVLVHGFTQSGASWRPVVSRLRADVEVLTPDLPGHGRASDVVVAGMSDAAEHLAATGGRATYVGYSLGGRICLTLALEHPELVASLVLASATAGIIDPADREARRKADGALADRLDPPAATGERGAVGAVDAVGGGAETSGVPIAEWIESWLAGPLFAHLDDAQADRPSRLVNTGPGLASSLRSVGTGNQTPSWDQLHRLSMPVLLVTGARDEKFGGLAREMAAAIGANARHVEIPGAGHAVPFEDPATFAKLVEENVNAIAS